MSYSSEVLADSPLAYYRLDEASGTTMVDSSGNGHNGTYGTAATLGATSLLASDADAAVSLNGTANSYGTVADGAWLHPAAITVEAWFNLAALSPNGTQGSGIVMRENWNGAFGPSYAWMLRVSNTGALVVEAFTGGTTTHLTLTSTAGQVSTGSTYHAALTFDGSTLKGYLNGSQVLTGALSGTLTAGAEPLYIGRESGGYPLVNGRIDEVAIYGAALSATRIAAHYTAGTTVVSPTGTLSATLPHLGASASGSYGPSGSVAATLPSLTTTAAGTYQLPGTSGDMSATLPSLAGDLEGSYALAGQLAATLPSLTASLVGTTPVDGSIAATLPSLAGQFAAVEGTDFLIATLPSLQAAVSGVSLAIVGTDTTVGSYGYSYTGSGVLDYDPPVTPEPAHGGRAHVRRIHRSMPTPTLTDGSPR